jgi:hypothetical protein
MLCVYGLHVSCVQPIALHVSCVYAYPYACMLRVALMYLYVNSTRRHCDYHRLCDYGLCAYPYVGTVGDVGLWPTA